jgi:hypothetical protein
MNFFKKCDAVPIIKEKVMKMLVRCLDKFKDNYHEGKILELCYYLQGLNEEIALEWINEIPHFEQENLKNY